MGKTKVLMWTYTNYIYSHNNLANARAHSSLHDSASRSRETEGLRRAEITLSPRSGEISQSRIKRRSTVVVLSLSIV